MAAKAKTAEQKAADAKAKEDAKAKTAAAKQAQAAALDRPLTDEEKAAQGTNLTDEQAETTQEHNASDAANPEAQAEQGVKAADNVDAAPEVHRNEDGSVKQTTGAEARGAEAGGAPKRVPAKREEPKSREFAELYDRIEQLGNRIAALEKTSGEDREVVTGMKKAFGIPDGSHAGKIDDLGKIK